MKILKVKIKKERQLKQCHFKYPKGWDTEKISVLAYEDHPKNFGRVQEDCLCVTDDETGTKLLKQSGVGEISKDEANIFGRKWRPVKVFITNEVEIISIIKKILSNQDLFRAMKNILKQGEIDSLNEKKSKSGIKAGKKFNIEEFIQTN